MDSCSPSSSSGTLPQFLCKIVTPLKLVRWQEWLEHHPDKLFVEYILRGIKEGFRLGCDTTSIRLKSCDSNMASAAEHADIVSKYLGDELVAQRIIKVGSEQEAKKLNIQCSPFGVIPKKKRPDKWRLIVDLSSPEGHSFNDGIKKELASLSYVPVDDVIDHIIKRGRGAIMVKMDIRQAYRNIPVYPVDRLLLGMCWEGIVYVDATLHFGLRSAPLLFSPIADALQWVMQKHGVGWVFHYIDDWSALRQASVRHQQQQCMQCVRRQDYQLSQVRMRGLR